MQRSLDGSSPGPEVASELDLRALGAVLKQRRRTIIIPTALAFLVVGLFVSVATPRYTAESQVLLENQETFFTRPDRSSTPSEQASLVDPEAVGSQIQLITSRDLARRTVRDLKLQDDPEFDPSARGMGALKRVLVLVGLARDPTQDTLDARIIQTFSEKLTVFSPPKTRVITIQFQSKDPERAAQIANKVAELYLAEQSRAKRAGAKEAADALAGQIADLRLKLAKADAEREQYRASSGLLAGANNMTVSGQQLADINSDLSRARGSQAEAQAKASLIRDLLRAGKATDVTDVVNNDLVRRVGEQRVTAQAQLAQESRTLLPGHPRIKELTAQVADLTAALKAAAKQAQTTLENDAKIAGQRVANLEAVLAQQKKVAGTANGDEVRLRSLDRVAQSLKDQLDSSSAKYQEALSRQTSSATPADARIIARAVPPQEPSYPKKLPFILFGTVATLVFATGFVVARELLGTPAASRAVVETPVVAAVPVAPAAPAAILPAAPPPAIESPTPLAEKPVVAPVEPPVAALPELPPSKPVSAEAATRPARVQTERVGKALSLDFAAVVEKLKAFGQSAAASRIETIAPTFAPLPTSESGGGVGWDGGLAEPQPMVQRPPPPERPRVRGADIAGLAAHIVATHVPGRGLHVVGASLGAAIGAADDLLALGRSLSERGRSIVVDLDVGPANLAPLVDGEDHRAVAALPGLSELLSGTASFAEVIHRDHASRLHFVPTGRCEADFRDFDLILDALSETYDFIILLAPAFPRSDIAKVMAPYADLVVLTGSRLGNGGNLAALKAELIDAGAPEVLVTDAAALERREPNVA